MNRHSRCAFARLWNLPGQASYGSSVETFPLTVPALNGASAVNTLTIRPASGATALAISSADTSTAGVALRFINEASGNTLKFVTLRGVNTSAGSGTVVFSTTTGANGNDHNT